VLKANRTAVNNTPWDTNGMSKKLKYKLHATRINEIQNLKTWFDVYATTVTEISSIADCGSFLATDASAIGTRDYIDRTAYIISDRHFVIVYPAGTRSCISFQLT